MASTPSLPIDSTCPSSDLDCTNGDGTAEAMAHLTKVYIAGLLILGLFGNIYCVTAFLMPVFRRVPSTLYLAALSLSDIGFLTTLGLMWMRSIGLRFLDMPHVCTACMFLSYFCCFVSSWLVFAITMERYILSSSDRSSGRCWSILASNRRNRSINRRRSIPAPSKHRRVRITFGIIIMCGLLFNSWVLFTVDSVVTNGRNTDDLIGNSTSTTPPAQAICDVNEETGGKLYPLFNALDMIFSFTLPFLGVLILNVKTGFRVWKAQDLARRHDAENGTGTVTSGGGGGGEAETVIRRQSRSFNSAGIRNGGETMAAILDRLLNDPEFDHPVDHRRISASRMVVSASSRHRRGRRDRIERKVTQLLVTVSLAYLVLNLPSYLHRIVIAFEITADSEAALNAEAYKSSIEIVSETIAYLMFYTQYSINFFLYSCHGCMFGFNC